MWGDGAGVPALGEHRHRHHTAGGAAALARPLRGIFALAAASGTRYELGCSNRVTVRHILSNDGAPRLAAARSN